MKQLTDVNEDILAGKKLGEVRRSGTRRSTGMKIQGWYITPPDFDPAKKYPLQLHIHGGPHSMYGVGFNFGWQEHAANGYVMLYTNPRGSTGYGSAFGNQIMRAYPSKDYDDLMAGVDELLKKGFVDDTQPVRHRLQRRRRADGVDRRPHRSLRGGVGELPGDRLAQLRRHDRRRQLVLQLREAPVGRPERAPPPLAAHVRRQRQDADDADDRRAATCARRCRRPSSSTARSSCGRCRRRWCASTKSGTGRHRGRRTSCGRSSITRYWFDKHKRTPLRRRQRHSNKPRRHGDE